MIETCQLTGSGSSADAAQIHAELRLLERHLQRHGGDGDCAYERALSRLYRSLVDERLDQLAALRAAGF